MNEIKKFKNMITGLYFACPLYKEQCDCPFTEYRNNKNMGDMGANYQLFITQDFNVLYKMYEQHIKCLFQYNQNKIGA